MTTDYNQICRLCLSAQERLIAISSIFMLYDKIMQLTNTPLFDGDGLPSKVCSTCCKTITEFYKFRDMCQSNFHVLQKYHLLPHKTQNIFEFISMNVDFQDGRITSNSTRAVNSSYINNNIAVRCTAEDSSITASESTNNINQTSLDISKTSFTDFVDTAFNNELPSRTTQINVKQEGFEENFFQEQIESLICTPQLDIADYTVSVTEPICDSSTNIEMTSIPSEQYEKYDKEKEAHEEINRSSQETDMTKGMLIPYNTKLKECRIVLQDCVTKPHVQLLNKKKNKISLNKNKNIRKGDTTSLNSSKSPNKPAELIMSSQLINYKQNSLKYSSVRRSLPLINKFTCSLCQKSYFTSEMFREHITEHTLKKIFENKMSKNSAYKFNTTVRFLK